MFKTLEGGRPAMRARRDGLLPQGSLEKIGSR